MTPLEKLTKWEYQGFAAGSEKELMRGLNEAGDEGWELVGIFPQVEEGTTVWNAFLKRPRTGEASKLGLPDTGKMPAATSGGKKAAEKKGAEKKGAGGKPSQGDDGGFDLQL